MLSPGPHRSPPCTAIRTHLPCQENLPVTAGTPAPVPSTNPPSGRNHTVAPPYPRPPSTRHRPSSSRRDRSRPAGSVHSRLRSTCSAVGTSGIRRVYWGSTTLGATACTDTRSVGAGIRPHWRLSEISTSTRLGGGMIILFFQAEDGIRDESVTGVQTCAL